MSINELASVRAMSRIKESIAFRSFHESAVPLDNALIELAIRHLEGLWGTFLRLN